MRSSRSPQPRFVDLSRRSLVVGTLGLLGGCSLRLEKDAPLPGPKVTTPSDVRPLRAIRARLTTLIEQTAHATQHPEQAHPLATRHRQQLTHVDATLKGLGDATTEPSPSSTPQSSHSDWLTQEVAWASPTQLATLTSIGRESRPMCMCIAATGLASAEAAGTSAPWSSQATFPEAGAEDSLNAAAAAIDAFEWIASQTPADKRGSLPQTLDWLYGTRAMVEAAAPAPTSAAPAPQRRYRDTRSAQRVGTVALQDLLTGCAKAAPGATTPAQVEGVLLAWTKTIRELDRQGVRDSSPFPGLAVAQ